MATKKKEETYKIVKVDNADLKFYAVQSQDGKWFKSKGYDHSGWNSAKSWVDDISNAKIYQKPGPAKNQITFWAKKYPTYGVPYLVEISIGKCTYYDQEERVKKSILLKEKASIKNMIRWLNIKIDDQTSGRYRNDMQLIELKERLKVETEKLKTLNNKKS